MGWGLLETCAAIKCEENHRPSGHKAALLACWDEGGDLEGNLGEKAQPGTQTKTPTKLFHPLRAH